MKKGHDNIEQQVESGKSLMDSKKVYKKPALLDYGTVSELTKTTAKGGKTDRPYAPLFPPSQNMTP